MREDAAEVRMPRILLSYRRVDSQAISGRLFDRLVLHYGKDSVFIDIDNIPFGVDFRDHINNALASCDLVLAIIGPDWATGGRGKQGIRAENDWVRIEIEAALQRKIPVVPVLVGGRKMPGAADLPPSMADLAFRNGMPLDQGRDFHTHVDRLIASIDRLFASQPQAARRAERPKAAGQPGFAQLARLLPRFPRARQDGGKQPGAAPETRRWSSLRAALSTHSGSRIVRNSAILAAIALAVSATFIYLAETEVERADARAEDAMNRSYTIERPLASVPVKTPMDN